MTSIKTILKKWDNKEIFDIIKDEAEIAIIESKDYWIDVQAYNVAALLFLNNKIKITLNK